MVKGETTGRFYLSEKEFVNFNMTIMKRAEFVSISCIKFFLPITLIYGVTSPRIEFICQSIKSPQKQRI